MGVSGLEKKRNQRHEKLAARNVDSAHDTSEIVDNITRYILRGIAGVRRKAGQRTRRGQGVTVDAQ